MYRKLFSIKFSLFCNRFGHRQEIMESGTSGEFQYAPYKLKKNPQQPEKERDTYIINVYKKYLINV